MKIFFGNKQAQVPRGQNKTEMTSSNHNSDNDSSSDGMIAQFLQET